MFSAEQPNGNAMRSSVPRCCVIACAMKLRSLPKRCVQRSDAVCPVKTTGWLHGWSLRLMRGSVPLASGTTLPSMLKPG